MAGRGPAPKETLQRESRTQARAEAADRLSSDGVVRGFDLPDGVPWHSRTVVWWDTWRRSPLASRFTDTDWQFLLETALLHTALWSGKTDVAPELRLRVAKFGATIEDRQRLKLSIDAEAEAARREPVRIDPARRKRLTAMRGGAA